MMLFNVCATVVLVFIFVAIVALLRQLVIDWRAGEAGPSVEELYEQHRASLEAMNQTARGADIGEERWQ